MTGFPGFLASYLLEELFERQPKQAFYLLVQPKFHALAQTRVEEIRRAVAAFEGTVEIVDGDITDPKLGVSDETYDAWRREVGVVWHLAAIYDLAVPELVAYQVNVGGTNHVLDFCEACKKLTRFNYVSTCFVSGQRQGTIFEDELDEGQAHHNHYEATKFWAEVEVQRRSDTIPTAIFRPAIVVGDSRTGRTDKYDGPYYLLRVLRKFPDWLPFPTIGNTDVMANVAPIDFVARAIATIGLDASADGGVFQVADPNPMRVRDVMALALRLMNKPASFGSVPPRLVKAALENERLEEALGFPRQIVRYFTHDARYDTRECQKALAGTDVWCPHLSTYLQVLLDYVDQHPEKEFLDRRRV